MSPVLILLCFFVVVMGSVLLAGYMITSRPTAATNPAEPDPPKLLPQLLLRVGEAVPGSKTASGKLDRQLLLAGYRHPNAANIFGGIRIAAAISTAMLGSIAKVIFAPDSSGSLIALLCFAGIGYLIPDRYLGFRIKSRARQLLDGIPSTLDLLVLSLEAGQPLDSALLDVTREIRVSFPALSSELNRVQMELLAGRDRTEVFNLLRERSHEPELQRLSQIFIDADRFGTTLAPTLRQHVKYLRLRLRQQAQEQARKVSVKLIFPVFFLIFPAVILVTLGPAVIQVYTQLGAMMDGK